MSDQIRLALTGFMGVGKSSVARHLARITKTHRIDLDFFIEAREKRTIAQIIDTVGVDRYREMETHYLQLLLAESTAPILSLGGGTWTVPANRELIKQSGFTSVWLESTFEHCWLNITFSKKDRPLARDKKAARKLFDERQTLYCLADWHFLVRNDLTSHDVARDIADQILS